MERSTSKRFKLGGVCIIAALALVLAVLPASSAFAKAAHLNLTEGGPPVGVGSPGDTSIFIAGCEVVSAGKVTVNSSAKDKLAASTNASTTCGEGGSESGTVTETQIGAKGTLSLKAKLTVTEPGPCVYVFSKFKTTFEVPGPAVWEGTTTGKVSKKLSSLSCEKTQTTTWFGDATNEVAGVPFEAELG
jgi:hypothetical protein